MAEPYTDDLFESTKMTFGEHLEELRICLFRAVIGLVVGFVIGLFLAGRVVRAVQIPLKAALEDFYTEKTLHRLAKDYPDLSKAEREQIAGIVSQYDLQYDRAYVERSILAQALGKSDKPSPAGGSAKSTSNGSSFDVQLPPPDIRQMRPIRIWRPVSAKITSLNAQEAFLIWVKAAFVTGLVLASPYVFYQLWTFVSAGLYPHERRYVYVFLPISAALFWAGAALAFFGVFRYVLKFLLSFNESMNIDAEPRISEWISLVLMLPVGFGIAFQLPLAMLFLQRLGIFTIEAYTAHWKIAVLVITVLSMLLTPADPMSMLMLGIPLVALYFLGIAFCRWMPRGRNPFREAYEP